ncbi:MAG: DUF971 domain-containing protein [Methylovirgula sp.]
MTAVTDGRGTDASSDGVPAQAPSEAVSPLVVSPPNEVRVFRDARRLELEWADGTVRRYGFAELRRQCRCADCTARRRAGLAIGVQDDIEIVGVNPMGTGALQFVFSDGHERGIFPWPYFLTLPQAS